MDKHEILALINSRYDTDFDDLEIALVFFEEIAEKFLYNFISDGCKWTRKYPEHYLEENT